MAHTHDVTRGRAILLTSVSKLASAAVVVAAVVAVVVVVVVVVVAAAAAASADPSCGAPSAATLPSPPIYKLCLDCCLDSRPRYT